jgi:hypothetical protein
LNLIKAKPFRHPSNLDYNSKMTSPRIALIHATPLAVPAINDAFKRIWPEALCQNLLDDTLSQDLALEGQLTPAMVQRFMDLSHYTLRAGCEAILFTCSAFGAAIEAVAKVSGVPTLKPNEAMFEQALALTVEGKTLRVGLIATFNPSIDSMSLELRDLATKRGVNIELYPAFIPNAMQDLANGNAQLHHDLIAQGAASLPTCDVILLAQFSMAAAQPTVCTKLLPLKTPVLSSPDCAVTALRAVIAK